MTRRSWAHLITAAAVAAVSLAVAAPAGAATAPGAARAGADGSAAAGPAEVATAYLEARAAAVAAADPAAALTGQTAVDAALAHTEAQVASGAALRGRRAGRTVESATCDVSLLDTRISAGNSEATVTAHAVTRLTWRSRDNGKTDVEGSGVDHVLTLVRRGDTWVVTSDAYTDVLKAACLEAAGAPRAKVRSAGRAVERTAKSVRLPRSTPARTAASPRRYKTVIKYDRAAAQAYADRYALSYNPAFVRFAGADCANFASQCAHAGHMPQQSGSWSTGWWYSKHSSASPADDTYSLSWINVTKQTGFWNGRRTDWVASAGRLSRGDFIFYDWSGDGVWDHAAMVAGTNSAGQKVIDAHTTDHYRVYWKLGYSKTKYRYAKVRPQWVVT